ncbi:hypothetical protein STXM2123_5846 [Streptomyces sp. F-3]|nr:hypothetical protein STXM2123_5846 [Streptomyces sp. F-3]
MLAHERLLGSDTTGWLGARGVRTGPVPLSGAVFDTASGGRVVQEACLFC